MPDVKTKLVFKKDIGLIAWPCTIRVPQDGGGHQEQQLVPRFKVIAQERIETLYGAAARTAGDNPDTSLLGDVIDGFDGFKDETGAPVPDADAIAWAVATPYVRDGLIAGYFDMLGRRAAKN